MDAFDKLSEWLDENNTEMTDMRDKAMRGAHVFFTQPTFDRDAVVAFAESAASVGTPLIVGVMVLASARNARFMAENVPGVAVSDVILHRLDAAGDDAPSEAITLAQEFIESIRPHCAGIYLIPTLGRMDATVELVRRLRPSPAPH